MKTWIRRVRGVLGSGLIWAAAWSVVGAGLGLVLGLVSHVFVASKTVVGAALVFGLFGLIAGSSFGALLLVTQGRRTLQNVSSIGAIAIGFTAGFAAPAVLGLLQLLAAPISSFISLGILTGLVGAGVSRAVVSVAKRADLSRVPAGPFGDELGPGST